MDSALQEIANDNTQHNQRVISDEPLSIPEGKENTDSQGRIVIEVVSPPTFNLKKKKGNILFNAIGMLFIDSITVLCSTVGT